MTFLFALISVFCFTMFGLHFGQDSYFEDKTPNTTLYSFIFSKTIQNPYFDFCNFLTETLDCKPFPVLEFIIYIIVADLSGIA